MLDWLSITQWRHMGESRYTSTILGLDTRWRWVVSFKPRPLYPWGKSSRYPSDRRLDGPQSRFGCREVEKNLLPVPWIKLRSSSQRPSLCRLSYPGSWNKLTIFIRLYGFRNGVGAPLFSPPSDLCQTLNTLLTEFCVWNVNKLD
jgi:hypothetical protein